MKSRKPLGNITNCAGYGPSGHSRTTESQKGRKNKFAGAKPSAPGKLPFFDESIEKYQELISISPAVFKLLNYRQEKEMFVKYILPDMEKLSELDTEELRDGRSSYSIAKLAEFKERNLEKAQLFYQIAILENDRMESAIKDLASVMHQQGSTQKACEFLERCESAYKDDMGKFQNLLKNLKKQIVPSGNWQNKNLVVVGVPSEYEEAEVRRLFGNSSRVQEIEFYCHSDFGLQNRQNSKARPQSCGWKIALVNFASHSAAKKTLESVLESAPPIFWANTGKSILELAMKPSAEPSISHCRPGFSPWGADTWESCIVALESKDEAPSDSKTGQHVSSDPRLSADCWPGESKAFKIECPLADQLWKDIRMRENRARIELETSPILWSEFV